MQIAFWSPNHGQTGTTTATMVYGAMTAMLNNYKVLLAHSQFERSTMERCLLRDSDLASDDLTYFRDHGMGALRRLAKNGRLTSGMVSDYTTSLLANRNLDLLEGINGKEHAITSEETDLLRRIYKVAKEEYDLVFLDIHSGMKQTLTRGLIEDSDIVVVCLNQNLQLIQRFLDNEEEQSILQDKKVIYHFARYDGDSRYRLKNLAKLYKFKAVITLPYYTGFMDACNQQMALEFLSRHIEVKSRGHSYDFIQAIKTGIQALMTEIESIEEEVYRNHG